MIVQNGKGAKKPGTARPGLREIIRDKVRVTLGVKTSLSIRAKNKKTKLVMALWVRDTVRIKDSIGVFLGYIRATFSICIGKSK